MNIAAGLMAYRRDVQAESASSRLNVLLAHPGGPYWANKDDGSWTIPKGLCEPTENTLQAAVREFTEETGYQPPAATQYVALGEVKMKSSSKRVSAWAFEMLDDADFSVENATSNTFQLEWPPKSGRLQDFPEVDRVEWFHHAMAEKKLLDAQSPFVDRLRQALEI